LPNFPALLLTLTLTVIAPPVLAQGAQVAFGTLSVDPSLPVEVTADSLDVNQSDGTAIFTGNVVIGQGEMRLSAARVLVVYDAARTGIDRLEATGGVTLVNGAEAAEAQRADYDIDGGSIVMTGDVLLTQGASALAADRMVVDLSAGTAQMTGRVKTVLATGAGDQ
jgi:lipopolysaccharide export system protein LptA